MFKVWWFAKNNNFGDILTPYLLDHFNIPYEYVSRDKANMFVIGSIARRANNHALVLGSGCFSAKEKVNPNARYLFVRGPHTRNNVLRSGGQCPQIYGDAAMLLPEFCSESKKKYDIGIVPHFSDYDIVKEKYPSHYVINLLNPRPLEVVKQITSCKKIISSSLHGIIAAHAYNIPAAWVKFSNNLKGDDTKFKDHFESVNCQSTLSTMQNPVFTQPTYSTVPLINIFNNL